MTQPLLLRLTLPITIMIIMKNQINLELTHENPGGGFGSKHGEKSRNEDAHSCAQRVLFE